MFTYASLDESSLRRKQAVYPALELPPVELMVVGSSDGVDLATEVARACWAKGAHCCLVAADFAGEAVTYAHGGDATLLRTLVASTGPRAILVVGEDDTSRAVQRERIAVTWRLSRAASSSTDINAFTLATTPPFVHEASAPAVRTRLPGPLVVALRSPPVPRAAREALTAATTLALRYPHMRFLWCGAERAARMQNLELVKTDNAWEDADYFLAWPRDCVCALRALLAGVRVVCCEPMGLPALHAQADGAPLCVACPERVFLRETPPPNLRRPEDVAAARALVLELPRYVPVT